MRRIVHTVESIVRRRFAIRPFRLQSANFVGIFKFRVTMFQLIVLVRLKFLFQQQASRGSGSVCTIWLQRHCRRCRCCTIGVKVCEVKDSKCTLGEGSKLVLRIGYCYTRISTAYVGAASSCRYTTIYDVNGGGFTRT